MWRGERLLQCTETHKWHLWQSLKQVKTCFLSLTNTVQCACILFFPSTSQNHMAASTLLMGAVHYPHASSAWELLGQMLAGAGDWPVGDHEQLCRTVAGLVAGAEWVTAKALAAGHTEAAWSWQLGSRHISQLQKTKWSGLWSELNCLLNNKLRKCLLIRGGRMPVFCFFYRVLVFCICAAG